jgi:hypothetical protein
VAGKNVYSKMTRIRIRSIAIYLAVLVLIVASVACSSSSETAQENVEPMSTQSSSSVDDSQLPTETPDDPSGTSDEPQNPTVEPTRQVQREEPAEPDLIMTVLFPADGETVNGSTVRVLVEASLDSQIDISGILAEADMDGTYFADITLEDGPNLIEVTGININDAVVSEQLIVFADLTSTESGLSIVAPRDGDVTTEGSIELVGLTSVDSLVQVNGVRVDPDTSGLFELTIDLDAGPNLIEIISINLTGESETAELIVFSLTE